MWSAIRRTEPCARGCRGSTFLIWRAGPVRWLSEPVTRRGCFLRCWRLARRTDPVAHRIVWNFQRPSAYPTALLTWRRSGAHGLGSVPLIDQKDHLLPLVSDGPVVHRTGTVGGGGLVHHSYCSFCPTLPTTIWGGWGYKYPKLVHWRPWLTKPVVNRPVYQNRGVRLIQVC
jgi:hypothetical protein